jgi:hypothetical protein
VTHGRQLVPAQWHLHLDLLFAEHLLWCLGPAPAATVWHSSIWRAFGEEGAHTSDARECYVCMVDVPDCVQIAGCYHLHNLSNGYSWPSIPIMSCSSVALVVAEHDRQLHLPVTGEVGGGVAARKRRGLRDDLQAGPALLVAQAVAGVEAAGVQAVAGGHASSCLVGLVVHVAPPAQQEGQAGRLGRDQRCSSPEEPCSVRHICVVCPTPAGIQLHLDCSCWADTQSQQPNLNYMPTTNCVAGCGG